MSELVTDVQRAVDAPDLPDDQALTRWANAAWLQAHDSEVTIRIVDVAESADLNQQYRGKNGPTNVLSFPFEAPAGITLPLAGDLVIAADVVRNEAGAHNKALEALWAHVVVHGVLHLQGYDHIYENDAEVMEGLEIRLLDQLGYANPYESEETEPDS